MLYVTTENRIINQILKKSNFSAQTLGIPCHTVSFRAECKECYEREVPLDYDPHVQYMCVHSLEYKINVHSSCTNIHVQYLI